MTHHNVRQIVLVGVHVPHIRHSEDGMTRSFAAGGADQELWRQHEGGTMMQVAIEGGIRVGQRGQVTVVGQQALRPGDGSHLQGILRGLGRRRVALQTQARTTQDARVQGQAERTADDLLVRSLAARREVLVPQTTLGQEGLHTGAGRYRSALALVQRSLALRSIESVPD